jgi:protein CpxP
MKNVFLAAILVVSTLTFAQGKREKGEKLAPEQKTELQVKKMTLELDLEPQQQKEVKAILLEQAKKREAKVGEFKAKKETGKKLSKDEKFEMKNEMLDHQIEHKAQMKKILNQEQYKKWEEKMAQFQEKTEDKKEQRKEKRKASKEIEE